MRILIYHGILTLLLVMFALSFTGNTLMFIFGASLGFSATRLSMYILNKFVIENVENKNDTKA